ncbi:hypothetical protein [Bacillus cereus group sp. TH152-1LC]|uniref:hypothetical protein n=1 Tax=Bacillus cereus group sp. TH152-1LC TaxID=3018060 RepID=UPI0022E04A53|nr:hypothetical protein [Bacillus cereus group sp. TH152-1LC]MDA1675676.1 hypothetical protein [Bacillus cereus group sp. TH152-1LC]
MTRKKELLLQAITNEINRIETEIKEAEGYISFYKTQDKEIRNGNTDALDFSSFKGMTEGEAIRFCIRQVISFETKCAELIRDVRILKEAEQS